MHRSWLGCPQWCVLFSTSLRRGPRLCPKLLGGGGGSTTSPSLLQSGAYLEPSINTSGEKVTRLSESSPMDQYSML